MQRLAQVWTDDLQVLWERIARHDLGHGAPGDFMHRLAHHTGWPISTVRQAVIEYRRFCFVACATADPVTPSEEVDQVWHLHLLDTVDYWDVWCPSVLRRPLHHRPSRGDPREDGEFRLHYATTQLRYERFFGPPDEAFWPAAHRRFRRSPQFRLIDRDRWLLLPHPALLWHHRSHNRGRL